MRLLGTIERVLNIVGCGAILVVMALTCVQIVLRFLRVPIAGTYEFTELLLVGIVFLPLAYTQSVNGHIKVDVLVNRIPAGIFRRVLEKAVLMLSLGIFAVITWRAGLSTYDAWRVGDIAMGIIQFPVWPSKIFVPIGSAAFCLRVVTQLIRSHQHLEAEVGRANAH